MYKYKNINNFDNYIKMQKLNIENIKSPDIHSSKYDDIF